MQALRINSYAFSLPGEMNELSPRSLLYLAEETANGTSRHEILYKLFLQITGIRKSGRSGGGFVMPDKKELQVSDIDAAFMFDSLSFVFTADGGISPDLFLQKFETVEVNGKPFIGPANAIGNITWEEFCMTQTHLNDFRQDRDEVHLNRLIACLYRRPSGILKTDAKFTGDLREPFNGYITDERAELFNRAMPRSLRLCIFWYYMGSLEYIDREYPGVLSDKSRKKQTQQPQKHVDVFKAMNELTDVLTNGNVVLAEQVRQCNVHDVLLRIKNVKEEQKRQQAALDKLKKK